MSASHVSGPLYSTGGFVGNITSTSGLNTASSAAITAGTTQTQAGATAITTQVAIVTVGNASDGVVLPAASAARVGTIIHIVNISGLAGKLYAAGSDTVNLVAGATGITLTTGSTTGIVMIAVCSSATGWTTK